MIAADLTLTTNVANAYIQEASLEAQIDATRQIVETDTKLVETLKYQLAKGYASGLDLAVQQAFNSPRPPPPRRRWSNRPSSSAISSPLSPGAIPARSPKSRSNSPACNCPRTCR